MEHAAKTIRLTMAQALVRHLAAQYIETEKGEERLIAGGFSIFGHGNVICLGEALYQHRDILPLWRGQNEQSMALAAIAYSKAKLRQRIMFATASAGPGTTNMVTAAAVAHANRLPLLLLCGDTYATRLPDPVLQQLEHFSNPTTTVNDAFKSVTRYWDRITHPAQIIQSLPAAIATMLDPVDCGPAFFGLPQDVQGWAYDYPVEFFERRVHRIRRQAPDSRDIADAVALLKTAKRPMIIAGGGVQYSKATEELRAFAEAHDIPVVETIAGRANLLASHPLNCGAIGVTGSNSANAIGEKADVVLAIGTRLQDFTTGSWTAFDRDARIITINVGRYDAGKHRALPVVGDAKLALQDLGQALLSYRAPESWSRFAKDQRQAWHDYVSDNISPQDKEGTNRPISYAQVIGAINEVCDPRDRVISAAGGLPSELAANWLTKGIGTVDVEYGFSCMGYEVAGGWGARMAQLEDEPEKETVVFVGDGSYLIQNSDIYSSVLTGKKMIVIICDNGGFAVINKLQNNTGNVSFSTLIKDSRIETEPFSVVFEAHARAMGAHAETVNSIAGLKDAFLRARKAERTYVIALKTDPYEGWTTEGHTWWEIGIPEVSESESIRKARDDVARGRLKQRQGI
jgi:3D-(3,5/4)-trihydroxycyclohexane-1,2-dione acylhydrolase (decyclizing)